MDFDAGYSPYEEDETIAYNGMESVQEQNHQLSSNRVEQFDNVDSADNELKRSLDSRNSSSGKLFVGGISWETTEETFAGYFSKYGEITDSVIMIDKHSGRPRGFGFVTFANPAVADEVLVDDHLIDGRSVEVKRTVPREDMQQQVAKGVSKTKKVFIGGIPPSFTEDELSDYFSAYGDIVEHQILLDHQTGRSRGFGFVTFENEESVWKIFSEGRTHKLGGKQVEIKRAEPKRIGDGKPYGGSADGYGGKMSRGHREYGGFSGYGSYGGGLGFYGGFGGYGYGFGFGGPMYGGGAYSGGGFGSPGGYGGSAGYGVGGYGGYGSGKGYGGGAVGKGYGGGAVGKGYGGGAVGAVYGRYHPYRN